MDFRILIIVSGPGKRTDKKPLLHPPHPILCSELWNQKELLIIYLNNPSIHDFFLFLFLQLRVTATDISE
jgi:hypothetical protein